MQTLLIGKDKFPHKNINNILSIFVCCRLSLLFIRPFHLLAQLPEHILYNPNIIILLLINLTVKVNINKINDKLLHRKSIHLMIRQIPAILPLCYNGLKIHQIIRDGTFSLAAEIL